MTTTMPPAAHSPFSLPPSAVLAADARRLFPAISLRVRASLTLRRLAVENSHARADGANRRTNDDVRHAA